MDHSEILDSVEKLQVSGLKAAQQGNFEQALQCFKHALALDPNQVFIHISVSHVYVALNEFEEAIAHLNQALRLQPRQADIYNSLGRLYYKQGRLNEAQPILEKALRLDPNCWEAHYNLAHTLAALNQIDRSASHYREVLRLMPNHPTAHYNLGLAYFSNNEFEEAIKHLNKALELNSDNREAYPFLGQAYVNLGKIFDAIETYEHGLEATPNHAEMHHNLAILYLRNQEPSKAAIHFNEAYKLDPNNETAKHMMNSLSGIQESPAAPAQHIAQLFDQYADYYDEHMKIHLKYQVPSLLRNAIGRCLGNNPKAGRVLDLGCGTGQCGLVFRDLALEQIGVDLSPKMIEQAHLLGAYEAVIETDLNTYLSSPDLEKFDLIIAGDVFVYQGDLEKLFKNVAGALYSEGLFAFTTEYLATGTYYLQTTGRFAHSNEYIHDLAKQNNLQVELEEDISPREQSGSPIQGRLYVLKLLTK